MQWRSPVSRLCGPGSPVPQKARSVENGRYRWRFGNTTTALFLHEGCTLPVGKYDVVAGPSRTGTHPNRLLVRPPAHALFTPSPLSQLSPLSLSPGSLQASLWRLATFFASSRSSSLVRLAWRGTQPNVLSEPPQCVCAPQDSTHASWS